MLTLARYLEGRGSVKSLTRIEAEAFDVPYPLVSGWPARYGEMEITRAMLEDLAHRIGRAQRSTANKALRGLNSAITHAITSQDSLGIIGAGKGLCSSASASLGVPVTRSFPWFVLRRSKRARCR